MNANADKNPFYALKLAQKQISILDDQLLRRKLLQTETPCDTHPIVQGRQLNAFCSNDYLGLANHPQLINSLAEGAKKYGAGSGASHLISGHSVAHDLLEKKLAQFQSNHIPDVRALFFCTGYLANLTAITGLAALNTAGDVSIYSAALNHASLIDGTRLAAAQTKATTHIFDHNNLSQLKHNLQSDPAALKIIAIDGVFSMDGDIAPIKSLLAIAKEYDALLIVDDAHGFGVLGEQGHGLLETLNVHSSRIVYIGTLGKAAGISGAFICANEFFIEWLVQKGRPYIYSTASPPAIAHALIASLNLIEGKDGKNRRRQLHKLITLWQDEMVFSSWGKISSCTPIQPVILGSNATALEATKLLDEAGYWIPAIRPPTVPVGSSRLRITFSANHSVDDVQKLMDTLKRVEHQITGI